MENDNLTQVESNQVTNDAQKPQVVQNFFAVNLLKFIVFLAFIVTLTFIINSIFSEVVVWGIFDLYPFISHGIYVPDLIEPVTNIMTIIILPVCILFAFNAAFGKKQWRIYLNILLAFFASLFTVWLFNFMNFADSPLGFFAILIINFVLYYSMFSKLHIEKKSDDQIKNELKVQSVDHKVKNITLLVIYSIFLFIIFAIVDLLLYMFIAIYVFCNGEGTGCPTPGIIISSSGILVSAILFYIWWKIVNIIKKRLIG
jgi:hypothetical protein